MPKGIPLTDEEHAGRQHEIAGFIEKTQTIACLDNPSDVRLKKIMEVNLEFLKKIGSERNAINKIYRSCSFFYQFCCRPPGSAFLPYT